MPAWIALNIALASLLVYCVGSAVSAFLQRQSRFGHAAGIMASFGLAIAGFAGILSPPSEASWQGVFTFTTLSFRMNPLAGFFVLLIGIVAVFVCIYSIGYIKEYESRKSVPLLSAGVLLFLASMTAVVLASNVFTFLLSWESMSIVSFLLVMFEHEQKEVQNAGYIYIVMTHIGTVFLTIAFLIVARYSGSYSFASMSAAHMPSFAKSLVILFALIGFGTKAGLVPFHVWLPRAHPVAPSHVSALMSGVMIKTAIYGFLLITYQMLGGGPLWWGVLITLVGIISALLGLLHVFGQRDQKRMLAYSSIENMGLIFMGLGVSSILLSLHIYEIASFALLATLIHTFNHALFKSLLFLGAGAVLSETRTKNMDLLGGLIRSMPWTSAFALVGALSISALPPFNGFVGEWLMFQSFFGLATSATSPWMDLFAVLVIGVLTLTSALAGMAFVRAFGSIFLALPRSQHARNVHETHLSMRLGMGGLAALCLLIGVFPWIWAQTLQRTVETITGRRQQTLSWQLSFTNIGRASEHVSISGVLITLIVVWMLVWFISRLLGKRTSATRQETWACGGTLTPDMTYTATGYSRSIRITFQRILQPSRTLDRTAGSYYFPTRFVYASRVKAFAEVYLYRPIIKSILFFAKVVRVIQNGQVQSYLAYLFVTLIVILLLVK